MENIEAPLIINLAPTGMIPTREMSLFVPIQPDEIIKEVSIAAQLGITLTHLHARDSGGQPSCDKNIYAEMIAGIRKNHPNLVVCVSCSGKKATTFEKRSEVLNLEGDLKPDMASLTLSSLNFEKETSESSPEIIQQLALCMKERGIKPELEIFDLGMANYAKYLLKKRILVEPLYANVMLGNVATAQPSLIEIAAIMQLLPKSTIWSVAGIGNFQLSVAALGVAYSNGVRIGLEDNLWLDQARLHHATNLGLVERVHELANEVNRPIMSPKMFRHLMQLPILKTPALQQVSAAGC